MVCQKANKDIDASILRYKKHDRELDRSTEFWWLLRCVGVGCQKRELIILRSKKDEGPKEYIALRRWDPLVCNAMYNGVHPRGGNDCEGSSDDNSNSNSSKDMLWS